MDRSVALPPETCLEDLQAENLVHWGLEQEEGVPSIPPSFSRCLSFCFSTLICVYYFRFSWILHPILIYTRLNIDLRAGPNLLSLCQTPSELEEFSDVCSHVPADGATEAC
jgi:hypothetical protein